MFDWENAIALHAMQGNRASSRGEGEVSWVLSSCGRHLGYILDGVLTTGLPEKFQKHTDFYFLHFQGVDVTFIYSTDPNKELPQTYGDFTFH